MNNTEALLTLRKVQAYRPSQIVDEFTADAWQEALDDIRYEDADLAVRHLGRDSSDYLTPAQIRTEVKRIRKRRHEEHGEPIPPEDLTPLETIDWIRQAYRRIGDGLHVHDHYRMEDQRPRPELTHLLDSKNLRNKNVG